MVGCSVLTANPLSCTIPSTGGYPGLAADNGFFDWRTEAVSVSSDVETTIQELLMLCEIILTPPPLLLLEGLR